MTALIIVDAVGGLLIWLAIGVLVTWCVAGFQNRTRSKWDVFVDLACWVLIPVIMLLVVAGTWFTLPSALPWLVLAGPVLLIVAIIGSLR